MSKKITILSIFLFIFCVLLFPEHVSIGEAQVTAYNWAEILRTEFNEEVTIEPGSGRIISEKELDIAYVFDFAEKGFVLISAEDYLPAIKFYTTTFDFSEHDRSAKFQDTLFSELENTITEVRARKLESEPAFGVKNKQFFLYLRGYQKWMQTRPVSRKKEVEPLIRTRWGQTGAENLKCPVIEGYRAPSGCVATAIAQIMRYHEWPNRGRGSNSYNLYEYDINVSANFDHDYAWGNMLNFYQHENVGTGEEQGAISTLMFDVGVALEMSYTPYGSAVRPGNAVEALPRYFKYSQEIEFIESFGYSADEWFGVAKNQLDQGLPIAVCMFGSESGHEVVIDGYREYEQSRTVHINFGWRGNDDGYYSLDNVLDFDGNTQYFLIGIKPPHYRHINAPENISAVCYKNSSLLMTEYHIHITWDETPTGDKNIETYIIYRKEKNLRTVKSGNNEKIGEVVAGGERGWEIITHHFDRREYDYTVIAVDSKGNKSKNPHWVKVEESFF